MVALIAVLVGLSIACFVRSDRLFDRAVEAKLYEDWRVYSKRSGFYFAAGVFLVMVSILLIAT